MRDSQNFDIKNIRYFYKPKGPNWTEAFNLKQAVEVTLKDERKLYFRITNNDGNPEGDESEITKEEFEAVGYKECPPHMFMLRRHFNDLPDLSTKTLDKNTFNKKVGDFEDLYFVPSQSGRFYNNGEEKGAFLKASREERKKIADRWEESAKVCDEFAKEWDSVEKFKKKYNELSDAGRARVFAGKGGKVEMEDVSKITTDLIGQLCRTRANVGAPANEDDTEKAFWKEVGAALEREELIAEIKVKVDLMKKFTKSNLLTPQPPEDKKVAPSVSFNGMNTSGQNPRRLPPVEEVDTACAKVSFVGRLKSFFSGLGRGGGK